MALKVYDVAKQTVSPTIKMVVAGEPGSGKTRTASTWPDVLYLDLDDGLLSVRDRSVRGIDVDSIDTLEEVKKGLDQPFSEHQRIFGGPVRTVVIDTLDELAKLVVRERLIAEQKSVMAIQDWGYLGDTMRSLVRGFRNLDNVNVIFNVHLKSEEDSETGRVVYKPSIQGAFGNEIAAYVDIAVLMKARTQTDPKTNDRVITRYLQTLPDVQYPWLKDRSGALPGNFPINFEDDYDRLHKMIFGALFDDTAKEAVAVAKELKAGKPTKKAAAKAKEPTETQVADAEVAAEAKAAEEAALAAEKAAQEAETAAKLAAEEAAVAAELAAEVAAQEAAKAEAAPAPAAEPAAAEPDPEPAPAEEPTAEATEEATEAEPQPEASEPSGASIALEEDVTADENGRITTDDIPDDQAIAEAEVDTEPVNTPSQPAPEPDAVEKAVTQPKPAPEPEPAVAEAGLPACAECGKIVENKDYADLSKIRFKKPLCREHFAAAKKG